MLRSHAAEGLGGVAGARAVRAFETALAQALSCATPSTHMAAVYPTCAHVPDYMVGDGRTYRLVADQLGSPRTVVDIESRRPTTTTSEELRGTPSGATTTPGQGG